MFARSLLHRSSRPITIEVAGDAPVPFDTPGPGLVLCERYRIEDALARGASAIIFRGTDLMLGVPVALKVLLLDGVMTTPEARAGNIGFREEAISAMRLSHPMILRVYNYECHPPWEVLVMELVLGETLTQKAWQRGERRLTPEETIQVGLDCLEGLAYAHGVGIVHNDIKPANILFTQTGALKICDFGLARMLEAAPPRRRLVAGTPGFMCPERLRGEGGDPRSDLFSLAATLYTVGNGRLMLPRDPMQALRMERPLPSGYLPLALHEVLCRAAAPDPRDRYQSACEMRSALLEVRQAVLEQYARFAVDSVAAPASTTQEALEVSLSMVAADLPLDAHDMVTVPAQALLSAHRGAVEVAAFRLDRTPVTNGQYLVFLDATGAPPPAHWIARQPLAFLLDHPVVGITLAQARRFAEWCGKRLATSAEWECAARPDGFRFPWGDRWDPTRCTCPESGAVGTSPVDRFAAPSPDGCLDLVGNVWEWTEVDTRLAAPADGFAWVFGGSFRHACQVDGHIARSAVSVQKGYEYLGFRCALAGGGG